MYKKPIYQEIISWLFFLGSGFYAFAAFIDAINNALSIRSRIISILCSITVLLFWLGVEIRLKKRPIYWITDQGIPARVTKLNLRSRLAVIGAVLFLWIPVIIGPIQDEANSGTKYIKPAREDEILIIVTTFKNDSSVNYDITGSIRLAVEDGLKGCKNRSLPYKNIRLEEANQTFKREEIDRVRDFGKHYNATLVIWGYYDDGGIFPYFTLTRAYTKNLVGNKVDVPQPGNPEPKLDNLSNPSGNIGYYVHKEIPQLMTYLTEFAIGTIFTFQGDGCAAISYFNAAIKASKGLDPKMVKESLEAIYANKGFFYRLGPSPSNEEAINNFTQAIELNPMSTYFCNRGLYENINEESEQAITDLTKCKELQDSEKANKSSVFNNPFIFAHISLEESEIYLLRGTSLHHLNRLEEAIQDITKSIKLDPNYLAYQQRGTAYLDNQELDKAFEDYSQAINLKPDKAKESYNNRAYIFMERKEYQSALDDVNKAIELWPDDSELYANRGSVYYKMNDNDRALIDFTKAIELGQSTDKIYYLLSLCYFEKVDFNNAIKNVSIAIELNPNDIDYYKLRADIYFLKINLDPYVNSYINDINKIIELDPKYYFAYINRGIVYYASDEREKAIDDWQKALSLKRV